MVEKLPGAPGRELKGWRGVFSHCGTPDPPRSGWRRVEDIQARSGGGL